MPLWVTFLRLRVSSRPGFRFTHSRSQPQQWRTGLRAQRSYNTDSLESQPDDETSTPDIRNTTSSLNDKSLSDLSSRPKTTGPRKRGNDFASLRSSTGPNRIQVASTGPTGVATASTRTRRVFRVGPRAPRRLRVFSELRRRLAHHEKSRFVSRHLRLPRSSRPASTVQSGSHTSHFQGFERVAWKKRLLNMMRIYKEENGDEAFGLKWIPRDDSHAAKWAENILQLLENGQETISEEYMSVDSRNPAYVWREVVLWLLAHNPRSMPTFLLATHMQQFQENYQVVDCLWYLATYWSRSDEDDRVWQLERLADTFCVLADRGRDQNLEFLNPFFRVLIEFCSDEHILNLYRALRLHNVQAHWNTYLHFTTYLARNHHFEEASEALIAARDSGAELNGWEFRSNCATLLRKSSEQPDGLRVCLRIVSELVDIGVKLNNPICDIVMLNAVEAGDLKTAFSIYHSLVERGLQPTESTFAVLLKGCKMDIDDAETLNQTIRDAIQHVAVRQSELCASEILHCLALHHSKHNPNTALHTLAEAYAQLFDVQPLYKLGLPISRISQQPDEFMPPTSPALNFMIGATMDHYLARLSDYNSIVLIYDRWRAQVEAGTDRSLATLATTDHTATIFLKAFILRPEGLIHATKVMRDMQRELPSSAGVEQIKPTVQSWSIFLHGFTRHGKTKLAEQVLNYMRSKGVEPNHVTWNTLVTGYARAQDDEGTIDALRRAEQGGLVWDDWTYAGLRKLRNQDRLKSELDQGRLQRQLDFTSELKQGLGARLDEAGEAVIDVTGSTVATTESAQLDATESAFADSPGEIAEQQKLYRPL